MKPLRSPTGRFHGKSSAASIWTKRMYQPNRDTTKAVPPPAYVYPVRKTERELWSGTSMSKHTFWRLRDKLALPCAACQYEPARHPKVGTRNRKIPTKTTLVRIAQIRKMKQRRPI
jgi:hypothetical protein